MPLLSLLVEIDVEVCIARPVIAGETLFLLDFFVCICYNALEFSNASEVIA